MSEQSDKARLLYGVFTGGYAHLYIYRQCAESMKGGVLMKSKHIARGKKNAVGDFRSYHTLDNFLHKSRVTAIAVAITLNKIIV